MTTLDRKTTPAFKEIEKLEILHAQKKNLSNGIPVYMINAGTEDVAKIDLIFNAGTYFAYNEDKNIPALLASATNHLLTEGTSGMTSSEIAEKIDYFGAFIHTECDKDTSSVSLFTLNKYLENTLPLLEEVVKDAVFPETEMTIYLQNTKQRFIVDSEKNHIISRRKFNKIMFGENHPYGTDMELEDFDNILRSDLKKFFRNYYTPDNCKIIVSGKIDKHIFPFLENYFGDWKTPFSARASPVFTSVPDAAKKHFVERKNQLQSAIRIGRPLFSKNHPDYASMKVVNTLLGGYFGSRLMANIREDKGYTYGIGSSVFPLVHEGCFFISTEVGTEVTSAAVKEVYSEIARIRNEKVSMDELQKVRNYMLGEFLRSIDGAFALADRLKGLLIFGLDYDYYDNFIRTVKITSPETIQELAQKYLQQNDLYEVVVGSKNQ